MNPTRFNSKEYWESRYQQGGNSGRGSYGKLADFKASILNEFVKNNDIRHVLEFGCGDGNQLKLAVYPKYTGLDVSKSVLKNCIEIFKDDKSKSFFLYDKDCFMDNGNHFTSDLALSLDVIYHLVEQHVYESYLLHLFSCSSKFVIIYSSNILIPPKSPHSHEFHRKFTDDVERLLSNWKLIEVIENKYKPSGHGDEEGSIAGFYIYSNAQ